MMIMRKKKLTIVMIIEGCPSPTHFRISSFYQAEDDEYPDEDDDGDDKNAHSYNHASHCTMCQAIELGNKKVLKSKGIFLATLVALDFTPVSESVSDS